jgi:hypothetical protein
MRWGIILFFLLFSILPSVCAPTGLFQAVKAGYCAEENKSDPYLWDFGQVKEGEILKHDFVFKNQTSDILEITNIHSSCGCTVSQAEKKFLSPQQSTLIKVTFNSKGYSGLVNQFVYVHTDNSDMGIIKFTIKAQVVKDQKIQK